MEDNTQTPAVNGGTQPTTGDTSTQQAEGTQLAQDTQSQGALNAQTEQAQTEVSQGEQARQQVPVALLQVQRHGRVIGDCEQGSLNGVVSDSHEALGSDSKGRDGPYD